MGAPDFFISLEGGGGVGEAVGGGVLRSTALEHPFIQTQWKI